MAVLAMEVFMVKVYEHVNPEEKKLLTTTRGYVAAEEWVFRARVDGKITNTAMLLPRYYSVMAGRKSFDWMTADELATFLIRQVLKVSRRDAS